MKNKIIFIFILVFLVFVANLVFYKDKEEEQVFCTADAMMCPDGSYVGRTGPNCEFQCPSVSVGSKVKINQTILNNGIYITPLKVVSDSRCPEDVTCVWAGEIEVLTRLALGNEVSEVNIKLGVENNFAGKKVTLTNVSPNTNSKKTIESQDYHFDFKVE